MTIIEYRELAVDSVEMRTLGDDMSFSGYASRFNSRSEPLPFIETVKEGAWAKSLRSRNEIKAFVNHNTDLVIGSTRAKTLRVSEDREGLPTEIDLPETTYGKDLSISVQRGDVSGMSVGMSVVKDIWNDDWSERTIVEARLHEVSVVTGFPAFKSTTATVRALARLAHRTEQDVDALADAFDVLQSGGDLTADQASILMESIDRSRAKADEPIVVEVVPVTPVSILASKLDLIEMAL